MKYIFFLVASTTIVYSYGTNLPFIDTDFDAFVQRMVPSSVRGQFRKKYNDFQEKKVQLSPREQSDLSYDLFKHAIDSLETDHKAWAHDIALFLKDLRFLDQAYDQERATVRDFLERYGLFKQFLEEAHVRLSETHDQSKTRKAWVTVKTSLVQASHKIGDWFKGLKGQLAA